VLVPTLNRRDVLHEALRSLEAQTVPCDVVVIDNASTDGTAEMVAELHPGFELVRNEENLGFGTPINRVALDRAGEILILLNNDVICAPDFVEEICRPFADPAVGMVAGVLTQLASPQLVDTAGIDLDPTLQSWDRHWNQPVESLPRDTHPAGPCGGAAAYRWGAFRDLGGFDETLFAYWEDVDLAIRFREAGWSCAGAPAARAEHRHGATLGAGSRVQRRLHAFGRGYLLGKYRVAGAGLARRVEVALIDWPTLLSHLVFRRDPAPIRERYRGLRVGRRRPRAAATPDWLATVAIRAALLRHVEWLRLRFTRSLPTHFGEKGE
jgi:GT2 family glycosyltransferase